MEEKRRKELEAVLAGVWKQMEQFGVVTEESIPVEEAAEDRRALGRRIGRLYLAFARVLIDRLGEEEAKRAILEVIRDYALHCAEARKKGMVDLPRRGIHQKTEMVEVEGQRRLRSYGCGIAQEFALQDEGKLGSLYCFIDPCSFMLTLPNIKMYHTKMEPLGDDYCEFDLAIVSDEDMKKVLEPGRDYQDLDPVIKSGTEGRLLK
ncbi:MAG: hypothetical protein V1742_09705, partial [Pseudomonadota bacterium]